MGTQYSPQGRPPHNCQIRHFEYFLFSDSQLLWLKEFSLHFSSLENLDFRARVHQIFYVLRVELSGAVIDAIKLYL